MDYSVSQTTLEQVMREHYIVLMLLLCVDRYFSTLLKCNNMMKFNTMVELYTHEFHLLMNKLLHNHYVIIATLSRDLIGARYINIHIVTGTPPTSPPT